MQGHLFFLPGNRRRKGVKNSASQSEYVLYKLVDYNVELLGSATFHDHKWLALCMFKWIWVFLFMYNENVVHGIFIEHLLVSHDFMVLFFQPGSIRVMGDKATARETMKKAGVPTVPGSEGLLQVMEHIYICWTVLLVKKISIFTCEFGSFIFLNFQSTDEAIKLAHEIGFPVMIKV